MKRGLTPNWRMYLLLVFELWVALKASQFYLNSLTPKAYNGAGQVEKSIFAWLFLENQPRKSRFFRLYRPLLLLKAFFKLKCTSKSKIEQTKCFTAQFYPMVQSLVLLLQKTHAI